MSQAIFLGKQTTDVSKVSSRMQDLGLLLAPTKPSMLNPYGFPTRHQQFYTSYQAYFPAFMKAARENVNVSLHHLYFPIEYDSLATLDLGFPDLIFEFLPKESPNETQKASLMNVGATNLNAGQKRAPVWILKSPTIEIVRAVSAWRVSKDFAAVIGNATSFRGFFAFLKLQKIIRMIITTHRYPAFYDTDATLTENSISFDNSKIFNTFGQQSLESPALTGSTKGVKTVGGRTGPGFNAALHQTDIEKTDPYRLGVAKAFNMATSTLPAPSGDFSNAPNCAGLYVSFEKELALDDVDPCIQLLTLVDRTLGADGETMVALHDFLSGGLRRLDHTLQGKELAHMCSCILMALRAQATAYPVISNRRYLGTLIQGIDFKLSIGSVIYSPITWVQLQEAFKAGNPHITSLSEIVVEVNSLLKSDSQLAVATTVSIRQIYMGALFDRKKVMSDAVIVKICGLLKKLEFPIQSWPVNMVNIARLLSTISGNKYLIRTEPMNIEFAVKYFKAPLDLNDIFLANSLSAFGLRAPSPFIPGGTKIPIADMGEDYFNEDSKVVVRFVMKPWEAASLDWRKALEEGYIIAAPPNMRVADSKFRSFVRSDRVTFFTEFKKAYDYLKGKREAAATAAQTAGGGTPGPSNLRMEVDNSFGVKRKREDDDAFLRF